MSYNPVRAKNNGQQHRQRRLDPHAGIKRHNTAALSGPQGVHHSDIRFRKDTDRGWRVDHFKGDKFEVVYEFICARNNTGKIVHPKKDRCLRVLSGSLYITVDDMQFEITAGQAYSIPKKTEYEMASMGVGDTEVLFSQGADYEKDLKQITKPGAYNVNTNTILPSVNDENQPIKVDRSRAKQTAEKIQQERIRINREKRQALGAPADGEAPKPVKKRPPLPGQVVEGSNPKPIGAGGYAE